MFNRQKYVAFLYTTNDQRENAGKKKFHLKITSQRKKYLGINLTVGMNNLYSENDKILKEFKMIQIN